MQQPNLSTVLRMLDYDPLTGIFTWKVKSGRAHPGKIAGSRHSKGYWHIRIEGRLWMAHQLAWLIVYKVWPDGDLDHDDTNKINNSIKNLRPATRSQNCCNQTKRVTNTTGFKGVTRRGARFRAQINIAGRRTSLGSFDTAEEAAGVYQQAAKKHHGAFARC